ncbi:universal stress protein [Thiohalocapsa sp.]|jgi:nucleotide-binding universal stress UspA family protein|uniref:universal stress protein n=1 Tax=Thiohalocapsa sp. TaxID=2497641 RepID=UPI0025E9CF6F|nr:universal stress protein [Thiohalocapsa sp.]
MTKVLLPVDGSEFSDRALDYVLEMTEGEDPVEVHLVSVQLPIDSGHARMFVSDDDIAAYHRDEGLAVLKPYMARLDAAGVSYNWHVLVGHIAQTIARFAKEQKFDKVVMGTHGRSGLTQLLMGSVAQNVIRRLKIPVALVK